MKNNEWWTYVLLVVNIITVICMLVSISLIFKTCQVLHETAEIMEVK